MADHPVVTRRSVSDQGMMEDSTGGRRWGEEGILLRENGETMGNDDVIMGRREDDREAMVKR